VAQIAAHDAVRATYTVAQKRGSAAAVTIAQIAAFVTAPAIDELVAKLHLFGAHAVGGAAAMVDAVTVVTIPTVIGIKKQITVLVGTGVVGKGGILIASVVTRERGTRHLQY